MRKTPNKSSECCLAGHAAEAIGMLVHAISDEAKAFYFALGLSESPLEPMTLMVTLANLRATLQNP